MPPRRVPVPRLTAEERAALEQQLADDDAAGDDDDYEVDYSEGDRSIRVRRSKLGEVLAELGFKHAPKPPAKKDDGKPPARKPVFTQRSPVS